MKSILNFYAKNVLFFAVFFLILKFIFSVNFPENNTNLYTILISFIKAFTLTTIILFIHIYRLKSHGIFKFRELSFSRHQSKSILSTINFDDLVAILKQNPATCSLHCIVENHKIRLTTDNYDFTFGEKITIDLIESKNSQNTIIIKSKPKFLWPMFDYGNNQLNIKLIEEIILNN